MILMLDICWIKFNEYILKFIGNTYTLRFDMTFTISQAEKGLNIFEALLGGVYDPCSLQHFTLFSLLPSNFQCSLLFTNFHCSLYISICSLLLFNFFSFSLIISLAPCSISQFSAAPCSLFQIFVLPAPRKRFPCSLLPSSF